MSSDWAPASTAEANARLSSPRWKKPSSGPLRLPRTAGDGSQRLNLSPRGPMPSRSELKRRLRASAEAAALALAEAEAARGSHATVPLDGGLDDDGQTMGTAEAGAARRPHTTVPLDGGLDNDGQTLGTAETAALALAEAEAARGSHTTAPLDGGLDDDDQTLGTAGVAVDVDHGRVQRLWSGADEVTLLAAAAAFRERMGRAPRRLDAGELFDAIKGSVSPNIDMDKAFDRLDRFESEFMYGALGGSGKELGDRRVRDLCAAVWSAVDVMSRPPSDDDMDGKEAGEGRRVADGGVSDADKGGVATERMSPPLPRLNAQSPSEGPSASAMDINIVPTPPSPSRSMKQHPFHPQPEPGADDGHPGRVPSPRRLGTSADVATLAHTAAAAARGYDDMTVHVDGEHGNIQSQGTANAQRLEPTKHGAARDPLKAWSDADEVALLNAAVAFRKRTGRAPRLLEDAGALLQSIRGNISPHIDEAKVSYMLGRFRSMFRHEAPGEHATAHDLCVHDLSAKVWGGGSFPRDKGPVMPVVRQMLGEFWKVNERAMAGLPLDKGLSLLGRREARLIETKWRQQLDGEMQTQVQRHDLAKEICGLLNDTIMDLDL